MAHRDLVCVVPFFVLGCSQPAPEKAPGPEEKPAPKLDVGTASVPAPQEPFHPFAPGYIDYDPPFDGEPLSSELRDDGLRIDDFELGTGPAADVGTHVTFHYVGYLDDGYVYDATRRRGRAHSFFIGGRQALEGFDRGLRGMRVGGQRRLHVPAPLAFGDRGRPQVPPGATIVFTVELLAVQGPFAAPTPSAELRKLEEQEGPELRAPREKDSRAAVEGDRLFVHYEQRDVDGHPAESTHRLGVPRAVQIEPAGWTAELRGMRVGGIRRVRTAKGTHVVELLGFDQWSGKD